MRIYEIIDIYEIIEESYGDVRIFSERIFGYKRYIVEYPDDKTEVYSGLWYKLEQIKEIVEKYLNSKD